MKPYNSSIPHIYPAENSIKLACWSGHLQCNLLVPLLTIICNNQQYSIFIMVHKIPYPVQFSLSKRSKGLRMQTEVTDKLKTTVEGTPMEQMPSLLSSLPGVKFPTLKRPTVRERFASTRLYVAINKKLQRKQKCNPHLTPLWHRNITSPR